MGKTNGMSRVLWMRNVLFSSHFNSKTGSIQKYPQQQLKKTLTRVRQWLQQTSIDVYRRE